MPFATVIEWLTNHQMTDLATAVAMLRIKELEELLQIPHDTLISAGWTPADCARLFRAAGRTCTDVVPARPPTRYDFHRWHITPRGNLKRALQAAAPNSQQPARDALTEDFYAPSSRAPRVSRWSTWCAIAQEWGMPPLPLTRELVVAIGSSMKTGGYRSAEQYFSQAKQEHREHTRRPVPEDIAMLIKRVERSITRGTGTQQFKDAFEVELMGCLEFHDTPDTEWWLNPRRAREVTIICCWWMLRGIEMAAATVKDVWSQRSTEGHITFFTLPIQKNDMTGMCVARAHRCICNLRRRNTQQFDPRPHHTIHRHLSFLQEHWPDDFSPDLPLFPSESGAPMQEEQVIRCFQTAIATTGTPLTRPGPGGNPLPRFQQHVCRVSGAQFLTRLGYTLEAIQLIGRWGSDAVKRYVQESALDATPHSLRIQQETTPQDVRQMVADHLLQLQHKYWIVNTATQTVHIPAVPDSCIENTHWFTVCGWRYGLSTFIRTYQLPEHNQCSKCFKYAKNAASEDVDLSD